MRLLRQRDGATAPRRVAPPASARWWRLALRLLAIAGTAGLALRLPLEGLDQWLPVKNAVVAAAAVILGGKSLYDTLFYDRFQP